MSSIGVYQRGNTNDIGVYQTAFINFAPTFTSSPILVATEAQAYTYNITCNDADGDPLTITAPTKPSWLSFVDNGNGTATLSGTPGPLDVGTNAVSLEVTDGFNSAVPQNFNIEVAALPPTLYWNERITIPLVGSITLPVGASNTELSLRAAANIALPVGLQNATLTVQVED